MLFTVTDDITSAFPAEAARRMGLGAVPLMCAQEIPVVGAMPSVVRVLLHFHTERDQAQVTPVYLDGAETLRDDLAERVAVVGTGLIGTSVAMAAVRAGDQVRWDADPAGRPGGRRASPGSVPRRISPRRGRGRRHVVVVATPIPSVASARGRGPRRSRRTPW